jgi:hypothetical protein
MLSLTFESAGMPEHVLLETSRFEEFEGKTIVIKNNGGMK